VSGETQHRVSRSLKLICFFVLNPIAMLSAFWVIRPPAPNVLALPFFGLLSVITGAFLSLGVIRLLKIPPFRAGSVFACGVFSNTVTFGGLIAFTFFREEGYGMMQLFTMLTSPAYYLIGYAVSSNIARGEKKVWRLSTKNLKENPFLMIPLTAITLGIVLNLLGLPRPAFLARVIATIVPVVTVALGIAIGLTLTFSRIRDYTREISLVLLIRHVAIPLILIPLAYLIGLHRVADGVPLKAVIILSSMPVAFNALVPAAIYGFDLDMANSAWIVSTASLLIIMPVLLLAIR
jgi:predicted permease